MATTPKKAAAPAAKKAAMAEVAKKAMKEGKPLKAAMSAVKKGK
jgi:hypothetical protein